jgi:hypothetical protein
MKKVTEMPVVQTKGFAPSFHRARKAFIPEFDTPQARTGSARYDFGQKTRKGSVTCWWWHLDKLIA